MVWVLEGRAFTLYDLKRSLISASGGYATGVFLTWHNTPVWELIETIELVSEVQKEIVETSRHK